MEKDNSRRGFLQNAAVLAAAGVAGVATSAGAEEKIVAKSKGKMSIAPGGENVKATTFENTKMNTVPLNWKEVYYTNCPLISASNVDQ